MKPTQIEQYFAYGFAYGGYPRQQTCIVCGKPYRGKNTISRNVGYGRHREFPAHVKCAGG